MSQTNKSPNKMKTNYDEKSPNYDNRGANTANKSAANTNWQLRCPNSMTAQTGIEKTTFWIETAETWAAGQWMNACRLGQQSASISFWRDYKPFEINFTQAPLSEHVKSRVLGHIFCVLMLDLSRQLLVALEPRSEQTESISDAPPPPLVSQKLCGRAIQRRARRWVTGSTFTKGNCGDRSAWAPPHSRTFPTIKENTEAVNPMSLSGITGTRAIAFTGLPLSATACVVGTALP